MTLQELLQENGAVIVDVRTPREFHLGHVADSVNIPLHELPDRVKEIRDYKKPVVLCCASGMRSGQAKMYLTQIGVPDCHNAGSWHDVNAIKQTL